MKPEYRIYNAAYHYHFFSAGIVKQLTRLYLEAFADSGNGHGEYKIADCNLHTVDDSHCKRYFNNEVGALTLLGINDYLTAAFLDVGLNNVHTDAASREFGNDFVGGKSGEKYHILRFTIGVFAFGLCKQTHLLCLCHNSFGVYARAVVGHGDDDLAGSVLCGKLDSALCGLAEACSYLGILLAYAVIHAVADKVHKRVLQVIDNRLVNFCVLALDNEINISAQLLSHIADDAVHLLEHACQGHHTYRHNGVLKLAGEFFKIAGSLIEALQLQTFEVGIRNDHGFGSDYLTYYIV